jgi:S1-C subfamily serine protease
MAEFDKTPSFKRTELRSVITSHGVVVALDDGEELRPHGSGFFVAPQLILTARHVVEEYWKHKTQQYSVPIGLHKCGFQIVVLNFPGNQAIAAVWAARKIWTSPLTDVAFIHVVPASKEAEKYAWPGSVRICPLPPSVGERIVGFGYPNSSAKLISRRPQQHITWNFRPHTTIGEVTGVFPEKRDSVMLNFPCFQTNARFDGGMSGGPILNSAGELAGMICAALDSDERVRSRPMEQRFGQHSSQRWTLKVQD